MLNIILGLLFAALGIVFVVTWFSDFLIVLKGSLPACVALGGLLAIFIGVSTVKENIREKQGKKEEETKKTTEEK
jgi:small neutral amino acid transporter SnatA (MarC family)